MGQTIASLVLFKTKSLDEGLGERRPPRELDHSTIKTAFTPEIGKSITPMCFVSAIVDGLRKSSFRKAVELVPGEADLYCARWAKKQETCVLTNDSDLLVHDIGLHSRVAFLKDIHITGRQDSFISFLEFHPRSIAERLDVSDLASLAFHAYRDKTCSLSEIVSMTKTSAVLENEFHDFMISYTNPERPPLLRALDFSSGISSEDLCRDLDPRTLEVVLQLRPDKTDGPCRTSVVHVFPPHPIDDIDRAWAYQPTQDLRITVYSLLRFVEPTLSQISECFRKDKSRSTSILSLHAPSAVTERSHELATWIAATLGFYSALPPAGRWRALAASAVLGSKRSHTKSLPCSDVVIPVVLNHALLPFTWPLLHFQAEVQATLWTLHLAREFLVVIARLRTVLQIDGAHERGLKELGEALESLPCLAEVFDWRDCTAGRAEDELLEVVEALTDLSAGSQEEMGRSSKRRHNRKKEKRKRNEKATTRPPGEKANVFNILTKLDDDSS